MTDDAILYDAMTHGDRDALATLYDRHAAIVYQLALHMIGERQAAEDIVHDVFLDLSRTARRHEPVSHVLRWLVTRVFDRTPAAS
jgi:RNA polymerase sigma-70 factor (ECF subfamily)